MLSRVDGTIVVTEDQILRILQEFKSGVLSPDDALQRLRGLPFEDLGFANVDHHRSLRQGFPEVVFGAGKTPEQVARNTQSHTGKYLARVLANGNGYAKRPGHGASKSVETPKGTANGANGLRTEP